MSSISKKQTQQLLLSVSTRAVSWTSLVSSMLFPSFPSTYRRISRPFLDSLSLCCNQSGGPKPLKHPRSPVKDICSPRRASKGRIMAIDRPPLTLGILLLLALSYAGARECKFSCTGAANSQIKLEPGKAYQYDLSGTTVTSKPGAKGDVSKLSLSAKVEIVAGPNCENTISLSNVETSTADGKKYKLDKSLGSGPTKFGLQGGKLEELCVDENEALPSLNIKRAVISLLQASANKESGFSEVTETDVFGICPTKLDFAKSGSSLTVKKTRDLNRCAGREGVNVPFPTPAYYTASDIQGSNLLNGDLQVTQNFENGALKSAESSETYEYNPAGAPEAGTKVTVNTKITLSGSSAKALPAAPKCTSAKPVIFDTEHEREFKGTAAEITSLLSKGCESRPVDSENARLFSSLVNAVAIAPKDEIITVYKAAKAGQGFKDKEIARKRLLDALYSSVSASSVEAIAELIKSKEISGPGLFLWYLRLGAVKHASRASLTASLPLIDGNAPTSAYLGLGTLGARFCSEHNCEGVPEVVNFQKKLADPLLKKGCTPASHKDEDQLISSLKGLANMKYLTKDVADKLAECALNRAVKTRVRSAVLDTIRSDPHKSSLKEASIKIFTDKREDSELRIKAYLNLAGCPCGKVADVVKTVLNTDRDKESVQVASFVKSHLRNVRASTNPDKASAKHHLGGIYTSNKFPIDPRKYSQNLEASYSLDLLNVGAASEANVIYSQKSWLPRALSVNLTAQLYGRAVNFLELDARLENLERVIEGLVGPKGYINTHKPVEVAEKTKSIASNILEKIASRYDKALRPKRSPATWAELSALAKTVKLGPDSDNDVNVDLSLKTFGSEIGWVKLHSAEGKVNPDKVINEVFGKLDEAINGAKDFNQDIRKHVTFGNHDITYPTGLGLALRLKAIGTAAVRVKADGKIDLPAILKNPKDTDFRLQLIPSAAIDVRGDLSIDGVAVETGVRVSLNMHTSTGTDLRFRILDGQGVDVQVGLPVKKQEIVSLKSDIVSVVKEDGKPESTNPVSFDVKRESYSGCFDQIDAFVGLTFCGKVSTPWEGHRSISPAYGPSELSLSIEKGDETLNSYHFKIYQLVKDGKANLEVLFDTPNSKEDRKISLTVDGALKPKKYLKVNLYSPWTQAELDGTVIDNDNELSASATLNHDGAEYLFKAGTKKTKTGNKLKLEPIFQYKAPEIKSSLIGRRTGPKGQGQAYSASGVILVELKENPYSRKWEIQGLSINTPRGNLVIDGTGTLSDKGIEGDNKLTFGEDSVNIGGHALDDGKTKSLKIAVSPSLYKDASFDILMSLSKEGDKDTKLDYENKLVVTHGPDPNSKQSRFSLINQFSRDAKASSLAISSQVTYPLFQVEGKVNLAVKPKSVVAGIQAQADKYKGGFQLKAEIDTKKPGDYNLDVVADVMSNSLSLGATRKVLKGNTSKFTNILVIKPGGKYELNANVVHNVNNQDIDLQVDAEAKLPVEPKNLNVKAGIKSGKSESKAHVKASAGGKSYIDAEGHIKKTDKPSGGYKVKLPGYVDSNGDFSYDGANLKGTAKVSLPKNGREAEAKANLLLKDNKVAGAVDICWDTKNPATKSLKIQTDSARLTGETSGVTTKNTITFDNSNTVVNGKYLISGADWKKKGSTQGELEVVIPSGYKVSGKGTESWDLEGGQTETIYGLTLQEPGKGPRDISLKFAGKNIDTNPIKFDTQVTLNYVSPDKKDAILHASLKKVPKDGGKWTVKGEVGSSGALIPKPLNAKLESEFSEKLLRGKINDDKTIPPANYKVSVTFGSDLSIDSSGKVAGTTIAGDLSAKLPEGSTVKSLKYSANTNIDVIPSKGKQNKIKTSQQLQWNDDKFIKAELEGICEDSGLRVGAEWETNAVAKRKLTGAAHWSTNDGIKADANANLAWEGKTADLKAKIDSSKDGSVIGAHATANTPDHGKSDLTFKNKIIKDGRGFHTDFTIANGDKKVIAASKIELDKDHPLIDISVDHPKGQSKLLFKNEKKGDIHYATEFKAKWSNNGGSIALQSEVNAGNIDNLSFKSNLELPDHKKIEIVANAKDGEKVTFSVKKDDKPYISGKASYEKKIEGDKKSISGKGELELEGQVYPVTYVATSEKLPDGAKMNLNVESGARKMTINVVRSPNDFTWERIYCKDAGKCSKAYIISKISKLSLEETEQRTAVQLDFSVFDPKFHDVGFESRFKRNGLIIDQNVEIQLANEKIKYNAYVHEKKSGVILALPKRTVGAELIYDVKKGDKAGNVKIEADLWLNKEKNDKICFIANTEVSRSKDGTVLTGETKLTHPALKKDLIVKGQASVNDKLGKLEGDVTVDVFKKPNQKIVIAFKSGRNADGKSYTLHRSASIKSEGCKLNIGYDSRTVINTEGLTISWSESGNYIDSTGTKHEGSASFEGSPKKLVAKFKTPCGITGELDVNIDEKQKEYSQSTSATIGGVKIKESLKYNLNENHLLETVSVDGKTIELEAGALIGKNGILKLSLDKKPAGELDVALDEANFLKSKYNYDVETLKGIWHSIATAATNALRGEEKSLNANFAVYRQDATKLLECFGNSAPDFSGAGKHISEQLKQIKDELLSDPTISELGKVVKENLGKATGHLSEVIDEIIKFINTITSLVQEVATKLSAIAKEVGPKVQESLQRISNLVVEVSEEVVQLSIKISDAVLDIIKKHEDDIKQYLQTITDFIHDFGKQFGKLAFSIQEELKKFLDSAIENLKDLPVVAMLKEKLGELKQLDIPEEAWSVYNELIDGLKTILPTQECEDFVTAASSYLVKVLKREQFNTQEAGKELYNKGEAAIKSLVKKFNEIVPSKQGSWKPSKLWNLSLNKWVRVPTGGLRVSIINMILSRDVPTVWEFLSAYAPSINPLDNIPPFKGVGAIIGGTQIITFDGNNLDTSGSCSYVLAEDYVDGNFSVTAKYSGSWYLESITISNAKESVSLVHKNQPLMNGKPVEFPALGEEILAIYRPNGLILKSKAGVRIVCDHLLASCQVEVSGFYFNKLRGLLGNLNYEPNDDLLKPDGEFAPDANALATAWRTNPSCAASPSDKHVDQREPICTELFAKNVELAIGRPWSPTEPWRTVCDHSLVKSPPNMKKEVACAIATSYVYFARTKGAFFLRVPQECAICKLGDKELTEWKREEVEVGNAADIVFVVEATEDNKEVFNNLNSLIAALKPELDKKGCSDVQYSVISFSPKSQWSNIHTSKGSPTFDGLNVNIEWVPRPVDKNATTADKVSLAIAKIHRETGTTSMATAYGDVATQWNFRPNAAKAVIGVHGKSCYSPNTPVVPFRVLINGIVAELRGASYSLITPIEGLELEGVDASNIVAYGYETTTTIDGKEHEGEADHDNDYCADAAQVSGTVIPSNNWLKAAASGKGGQFVNIAAQQLAKTITARSKKDLDCHCSLVNGLHPKVKCIVDDLLEAEDD